MLSAFSFILIMYICSCYFIIQISSSFPRGIYLKKNVSEIISTGQVVLFEIPAEIKNLMINRKWIPENVRYYLMKPVAATAGDHVSVQSGGVFVNHMYKGPVKKVDQQGLKLPQYHFYGELKQNTFFLLASAHNSFDSRYFGPIHQRSIISIVEPFILFP